MYGGVNTRNMGLQTICRYGSKLGTPIIGWLILN